MIELKLKDELLQEDVAAWNRVYVQGRPVGIAEQRQWQLQAAIVAGWIVEPPAAAEKRVDLATGRERMVYLVDGVEVGKMRPGEVFRLGRLCEAAFAAATTVEDSKN